MIKLKEIDDYIIFSEYEKFKTNLVEWISRDKQISDDKLLLKLIEQESKANDTEIAAEKLCDFYTLHFRLDFIIADLLEKGNCQVFNKSKNKYIVNIETKKYGFQIAPLIGEGGRTFFADGVKFFEIQDWIS